MRITARILVIAGAPACALLHGTPAQARLLVTACSPEQTVAQCEQAAETEILPPLVDSVLPPKAQLVQAGTNLLSETQQRLLNLPIGAALDQALATTTSLLPRFNLAGLPASGMDGGLLKGDWNLALPGADAHNSQLRLLAVPTPELARPVREVASTVGASVDALKEKLDVTDDISAQFTWSLRGHGFGRDMEQYRDPLSSLMLHAFSAIAEDDGGGLINAIANNGCYKGDAISEEKIGDLPATMNATNKDGESCAELLEAAVKEIPAHGRRNALLMQNFAERRKALRLDRFADLVSNQPQLTVSVKRAERAPLVGASLTALRVGFETGWVNLNSFLRNDGEECQLGGKLGWGKGAGDATASQGCADAYASYVERKAKQLDAQDRLSAWLEYAHLSDVNLTQAVEGVDLTIEGGDRYTAGLGYGRVLWQEGDDKPMSTRIDASGRFERYQNDDSRQDRLVYSVVLTQKVGMLNIPVVLAYADKSEYKGSEKDGLLANLGLSYDFGLPEAPALPQAALDQMTRVVQVLGD